MEQFVEIPKCCLTCKHCQKFLSYDFTDYMNKEDPTSDPIYDSDIDFYCLKHDKETYMWSTCNDFE